MKTVMISLNSIDKVKSFVNDISRFIDFSPTRIYYKTNAKECNKEANTYENRNDLIKFYR